MSSPAPKLRFLWDELLSPKVPQALHILGFNTSHVGHATHDQPPRGSTDEVIVAHTKRTNQVIVTSNHDMMLICAEAGQRFVWVDPRGRRLTRTEQVLLMFKQVDSWQEILHSQPEMCVRSMRTRCFAMEPSEAARLAGQRMREIARKKRAKALKERFEPELFGRDTEETADE